LICEINIKKMKNYSWPITNFEIWYMGLDIDSKRFFVITFCRICHIKGTLLYRKIGFFENFQSILDFSKQK
jgi:hypothetical protein